jgi:hypothetical protein
MELAPYQRDVYAYLIPRFGVFRVYDFSGSVKPGTAGLELMGHGMDYTPGFPQCVYVQFQNIRRLSSVVMALCPPSE